MIHTYIAGHVGADPIKKIINGQILWNINLAVSHRKETIWVKLNWWGENKFIESFVKKGSSVIVTGVLNPLSFYTNKAGETTANLTVNLQDIHFAPKKESSAQPKDELFKQEAFDELPF